MYTPPGVAGHIHDLPRQEEDKEDTDTESFNKGDTVPVEGGIFDAPASAPLSDNQSNQSNANRQASGPSNEDNGHNVVPQGGNAVAPPGDQSAVPQPQGAPADGGRSARRHRTTGRPPHIWPEAWSSGYSAKQRKQATLEWAAECKLRGTNWWGEPLATSPENVSGHIERATPAVDGRDCLPEVAGVRGRRAREEVLKSTLVAMASPMKSLHPLLT